MTSSQFDGKAVIVTGGGTGIGRATARAFAAQGAGVLVVGRTASRLAETAQGLPGVRPLVADVAAPGAAEMIVGAALDHFGRVDVLVNNAAVVRQTPRDDTNGRHAAGYEAGVAAHYLARQQSDPEEILYWNREALARADKVGDDRVAAFYPSLHVGVGLAYERLGDPDRSRVAFDRAREHMPALPPGDYGDLLRAAITEGLARLHGSQG